METRRDFYKFVNGKKRTLMIYGDSIGKDCVGTSLYLTGEVSDETFPCGKEADKIINQLKESNFPNLGNLVAWQKENGETYHLATIVKENPLILAHRFGFNKGFFSKESFEDINNFYSIKEENSRVKYLVPSRLQKILDKEESRK